MHNKERGSSAELEGRNHEAWREKKEK